MSPSPQPEQLRLEYLSPWNFHSSIPSRSQSIHSGDSNILKRSRCYNVSSDGDGNGDGDGDSDGNGDSDDDGDSEGDGNGDGGSDGDIVGENT